MIKNCLAVSIIFFMFGCATLKTNSDAFRLVKENEYLNQTKDIKVYVLPRYNKITSDSSEYKMYDSLSRGAENFLKEYKNYNIDNSGNIKKELLGKLNIFREIVDAVNPASIAKDMAGNQLNWQEKLIINFINKEFTQGNKNSDCLVLCLYLQPQYPCRVINGSFAINCPKGSPVVYSQGVSGLELGYILLAPLEKNILKREKVFLLRDIKLKEKNEPGQPAWQFSQEESVFLEKVITKLFNDFPMFIHRPSSTGVEKNIPTMANPTVVMASQENEGSQIASVPTIPNQPTRQVEQEKFKDIYSQLAEWRDRCASSQNSCTVKIETIDGPGWFVSVDLKGTRYESIISSYEKKRTSSDWINCIFKDGIFYGRGGKNNLEEIIKFFLNLVSSVGND